MKARGVGVGKGVTREVLVARMQAYDALDLAGQASTLEALSAAEVDARLAAMKRRPVGGAAAANWRLRSAATADAGAGGGGGGGAASSDDAKRLALLAQYRLALVEEHIAAAARAASGVPPTK